MATPPSSDSIASPPSEESPFGPRVASSNLNSDDLESIYQDDQHLMEKDTCLTSGADLKALEVLDMSRPDLLLPVLNALATNDTLKTSAGRPKMSFSSSPVLYPQSSSPPPAAKKRKLLPTVDEEEPKKQRTRGGFLLDDDQDDTLTGDMLPTTSDQYPGLSLESHMTPTDISQPSKPLLPSLVPNSVPSSDPGSSRKRYSIPIRTCSGQSIPINLRTETALPSYEESVAQNTSTAPGKAKRAYYGVEVHKLIDEYQALKLTKEYQRECRNQVPEASVVMPIDNHNKKKHQMWTEKYRAKKFTDLVGDERTHRSVLRWLKAWDPIVFPGNKKVKAQKKAPGLFPSNDTEAQHRKILVLTGPPGLGKTTLAHVCAKQAGYETLEINASDERSRDVVRGRIKDAVGTENVRGIEIGRGDQKQRRAGRPVCVVVDEVDGVVSGTGGGEGGFMKALLDLVQLDQKNSSPSDASRAGNRRGEKFRLMRPLILVCNDLYAPALRSLRTSSAAEIIHVRKPPLEKTIARLSNIFEREGIKSDKDAVRKLCEASWGIGSQSKGSSTGGSGEGDIRGVLVQGEWAAHKLRASPTFGPASRLTKSWMEENILNGSSHTQGLGRNGVREIVERVFIDGAGLSHLPGLLSQKDMHPNLVSGSKTSSLGVADVRKRAAIAAIREMADTCNEHDRLMTECFASYCSKPFQDDTYLSKPNSAYNWLHFHDLLSRRTFSNQDWELNAYLSVGVCAFHHLFASTTKERGNGWDKDPSDNPTATEPSALAGPRADYTAYEASKASHAHLLALQSAISPSLKRMYPAPAGLATELIPYVTRMLAPDVKPVVAGGSGPQGSMASVRRESERRCVKSAAAVMIGLGVGFERVRVEMDGGSGHGAGTSAGWALRMEPPLDALATFESLASVSGSTGQPVRYAVRQVIATEHRSETLRQQSERSRARSGLGGPGSRGATTAQQDAQDENNENAVGQQKMKATVKLGKRDFFGRIINEARPVDAAGKGEGGGKSGMEKRNMESEAERKVWVSFNEGFSNAVRKPISLREFLDSF